MEHPLERFGVLCLAQGHLARVSKYNVQKNLQLTRYRPCSHVPFLFEHHTYTQYIIMILWQQHVTMTA